VSRVNFSSKSNSVELRGSERAYAGGIVTGVLRGLIHTSDRERLMSYAVNPPSYLTTVTPQDFESTLSLALGGWNEKFGFRVNGEFIGVWELALNSTIVVGNDVTRLLARMHAQCEIHGWVAEHNRPWLAEIIREGRRSGLLREGMGWESVADLLANGDGGPVVTDYSVCDSFPNPYVAAWTPPDESGEDGDAWYDLPFDERWDLSVAGLQSQNREWSPDEWAVPYFMSGATVFDLHREMSKVAVGTK
jgi:hypothetical protein